MSQDRPGTFSVVLAICRLGMLRWSRKWSAGFRFLKRRVSKSSAAPRTATVARRGWQPILGLLFVVPVLLWVFTASSRVISALQEMTQPHPASGMEISRSLYRQLLRREQQVAESPPQTSPATAIAAASEPTSAPHDVQAFRQRVLDRLRNDLDKAYGPPSDPSSEGQQRQRFAELYLEKGIGAFRIYDSDAIKAEAFPVPSRWPAEAGWLLAGLAVILTAGCVALLSVSLSSSQDVAASRWDMEWLFTLPLPAKAVFLADLAKETVSTPTSWIVCVPFMFAVLVGAGRGWWSIPLAVASAAHVVVLTEAVRLPTEVYLRRRLNPSALRNLLAGVGLMGMVIFIALLVMSTSGTGVRQVAAVARALPQAVIFLPWALPLALCRQDVPVAATLAAMAAICAGATYLATWLAGRAVQGGLLAQGAGLFAGRRRPARSRGLPMSGMLGREILLLLRDRSYLMRVLVVPCIMALLQVAINPSLTGGARGSSQSAATLAFGLGAYMVLMSGTRLIINEGQGLWILFTLPKTLDRILFSKAALWSAVAATMGLVVYLATGLRLAEGVAGNIVNLLTVVVGVFAFGLIATAVGTLACDPMETNRTKQVPVAAVYLLMLIATLYIPCFYSPGLYDKLVIVVMFVAAALAFWRKVRAWGPYLLDRAGRPAPVLDVSDALVAVFAFYAIRTVLTIVFVLGGKTPAEAVAWGYSLAAVAVALLAAAILLMRRVPNLAHQVGLAPSADDAPVGRSLIEGLGLGLAAGGFAAGYLWVVRHFGLFSEFAHVSTVWSQLIAPDAWPTLAMVLVAAPVLEECLFRGLLMRSLARSTGPVKAVLLSSAIFAIMQPPAAFLPALVLGLAAAWSFRPGRLLAAPILVHLVYNVCAVLAYNFVP